ncbi:DUF1641 domain-containing protein [Alicyclobacillus suci]|uniref:DUF1641 domain-containing protein n=1 Tax=Alicyclobacillus suci TaxID=2816080 RepID=UPI001A90485B|nr:DUF1641 domain-containing protein [Alicyclobacillus suci]
MADSTTAIANGQIDQLGDAEAAIERAKREASEGVVEALYLLQDLEERGVLPLLRALIEQGDDVMRVVLELIKRQEYLGGMKNAVTLLQAVGTVEKNSLNTAMAAVSGGLEAAASTAPKEKFGLYDLLATLQDPDVSRALSFVTSFLKGMGRALGETEAGGAAR